MTISAEDIPVSKKDAYPRAMTGVAIWTGIDDPIPGEKEPVAADEQVQHLHRGAVERVHAKSDPIGRAGGQDRRARNDCTRISNASASASQTEPCGIRLDGQRHLDVPGLDRAAEAGE